MCPSWQCPEQLHPLWTHRKRLCDATSVYTMQTRMHMQRRRKCHGSTGTNGVVVTHIQLTQRRVHPNAGRKFAHRAVANATRPEHQFA